MRPSSPVRPAGSAGTSCVRSSPRGARCTRSARRADEAPLLEVISPLIHAIVGDVRDPASLDGLFAGDRRDHRLPRGRGDPPADVSATSSTSTSAGPSWCSTRPGGRRRVRFVHVSSNSPFGANARPTDRFTEDSPFNPYMGYGSVEARGRADRDPRARAGRRRRRHRPGAVVLRSVPTAAAVAVVPGRAPGSVPDARRRHAAAFDGVHRAPRAGTPAGRGDAGGIRACLLDRRRRAVRAARRSSPPCATRSRPKGSPVSGGQPRIPRVAGVVAETTRRAVAGRAGGTCRRCTCSVSSRTRSPATSAGPVPSSATTRRRRCSTACGPASADCLEHGEIL